MKMLFASVCLGACLTAGISAPVFAQTYTLTLATNPSPGESMGMLPEVVPRHIASATNGRVKIVVNDSLIPGTQLASAVRDKRVEMSTFLPAYVSAEAPILAIGNLPGLINTFEDFQKLLASPVYRERFNKVLLEKYNSRPLAFGAFGPQSLLSKKEIRTVDQLKGQKVRVHNSQTAKLLEGFGALPTPMVATEVIPALERGALDIVQNSVVGTVQQGYPVFVKHVQKWPLATIQPWVIVVNRESWDALPADIRAGITAGMQGVERELLARWKPMLDESIQMWKSKGIEVQETSAAEAAKLNSGPAAKEVYDIWFARVKEGGYDGEAFVRELRGVLAK